MTYMRTHKNMPVTLMDESGLDAVMSCDEDWVTVSPHVCRLVAGSLFTSKMFAFISHLITGNTYGMEMETLLDALFAVRVTEQTMAEFSFAAAAKATNCQSGSLPAKREIAFRARDVKLNGFVHDVNPDWEIRFLSRLLTVALGERGAL